MIKIVTILTMAIGITIGLTTPLSSSLVAENRVDSPNVIIIYGDDVGLGDSQLSKESLGIG